MQGRQWLEPQADWLPLTQAVFKTFFEPTEAEIADDSLERPSLGELEAMLKEETGANSAKIDPATGTFSVSFRSPGGGVSGMFGPPWAILGEARLSALHPDPRLSAESLFNRDGILEIGEEEAVRDSKQLEIIRRATGQVWRVMLRSFDRAVATNRVALYARIDRVAAPFDRLPSDIWPLLDVNDWQNGVAIAPDATAYWSIHGSRAHEQPSTVAKSARSRRPMRERAEMAIAAIFPEGLPHPAIEPNASLCRKVAYWLKRNHSLDVKDDTILRAAGRRK